MRWKSGVTTLALVSLLAACSSNTPSQQAMKASESKSLAQIPSGADSTKRDVLLKDGIKQLQAGDYEKATVAFYTGLNANPNDTLFHTLAGIASHLEAKTGKTDVYQTAEAAYKTAIANDPANKVAMVQLARVYMETKRFSEAQDAFAEALSLTPNDPQLLLNLASASYMAQDVETAYKTIQRALKARPNDAQTLQTASLVFASMGKEHDAQNLLAQLKTVANPRTANYVESRLNDWKRIHTNDRFNQLASLKDGPAPVIPAAPNNMALVDVVILRTEESGTRREGNNIFKQLNATFGAVNPINWSKSHNKLKNRMTNATLDNVEQFTITRSIGLQAFNYALQIANTINKSTEVIARPTLVALDNKMSSFFSGDQLVVGLTGTIGGGQLDRERIGVHLEFIPKFLKDGRVEFQVSVGRSFPEANLSDGLFVLTDGSGKVNVGDTASPFAATFQMACGELSANVVMEFGQTLILAGLSERVLSRQKEGFPILKDIPVLQYFFAEERTLDFHKHLAVMMTPRKPGFRGANEDPVDRSDKPRRHLDRFLLAYVGDAQMEPNIKHVFAGLEHNSFYKEFRTGDVSEDRWFHTKEKAYLIDQTLDMLYF